MYLVNHNEVIRRQLCSKQWLNESKSYITDIQCGFQSSETQFTNFPIKWLKKWVARAEHNQLLKVLADFHHYFLLLCFMFQRLLKIELRRNLHFPKASSFFDLMYQFYQIFPESWRVFDGFIHQSLTKYLRQTLVFMWNSEIRKSFNFCF